MEIQILSQFSDFREEKVICLNCINLSLAVLLLHVPNFLLILVSRASAIKSVYMSMETSGGKHTSSLIIVIPVRTQAFCRIWRVSLVLLIIPASKKDRIVITQSLLRLGLRRLSGFNSGVAEFSVSDAGHVGNRLSAAGVNLLLSLLEQTEVA